MFHNGPVSRHQGLVLQSPQFSYDFDNNGWPDIYVAVDSQPSMLFKNNHDGTFRDIAVEAGCAYSDGGNEQAGMGVAVDDYDCNGWSDIY